MKLLGLEIRRAKTLSPPYSGRWTTIDDPYTGAWQQDESIELESVLTFSAVFACLRLITSDIGKLRCRLMRLQASGVWKEADSPAFSPVLRKPNTLQTRIKFFEQWLTSKLLHGNAYILKFRDNRGIVNRLMVLDPTRVQTLVSDSGEAFYRLQRDRVTIGEREITLPATEIIHDVHVTPDHPLVGVSPIAACGLTALQGLNIKTNSTKFFGNMARPSGMLTAPGTITDATANRLKTEFQTNYGGDNIGKVSVAGDGLEFKTFTMSAVDSQLIEQLGWTAKDVCTAFGVPPYKIGIGEMPTYDNISALDKAYYSDTLQELIECIELLLDEGLNLPSSFGTSFDIGQLLRMDAKSRYEAHEKAIKGSWKSPNEVRFDEDLEPVDGGEEPISQQQNWPLSVLAKRPPPDSTPPAVAPEKPEEPETVEQGWRDALTKELSDVRFAA
jgi:HK97 family phage portal protein